MGEASDGRRPSAGWGAASRIPNRSESTGTTLPVGGRVGRYRLERVIGAGGMGTVHLAHTPDGRAVAVKVIADRWRADPTFRDRFAREVAAARRVAGFCTARVLDADVTGPVPYLVTEYVDGISLHERITRLGPLSDSDTEALAVGVAAALTAIHAAGVVHRDLTPRNVMLSPFGPKVIDFGVARAVDATAQTGVVFGTPGWLAPEQVAGRPAGPAADVYAWGLLILWATGRPGSSPGPGGSVAPVRPDLSGLGPRLAPLVARALHPDPGARPTARDLLLALCGSTDTGTVRAALTPLGSPPPPPVPPPTRVDPRLVPPTRVDRGDSPPVPRRRRRGLAIVVTLLVVGVCGYGVVRAVSRATPSGAVAAGTGSAPTSTGQPTPSPQRKATQSPSTVPATEAADGSLRFTVTALTCGVDKIGDLITNKPAQGQFCLVDLHVTNIGTRTARVWPGSQVLVDTDGREYTADGWSWVYDEASRPFLDAINPGNSVSGQLVFDTPKDLRFQQLVVHDSPLSRGTPIRLG
ncbi:MAG TPA: DUF4352 domain-containing protein [Micromonosporaceae bacterium]